MKIKWGILGAGRIAEKFVADFVAVNNGKVVAVGSRAIERSKAFASKFGIERAYGSYHDLINDGSVDIIYIATPHNFHFEQTKLCLENGKHVLCEKPATVNAYQFKELMVLAKQKKLFYMEAMWTPFLPAIQKARQWVDEGKIGELQFIQANFGFTSSADKKERLFNPELAGGSLLDIGIYPLSLTEMFSKSEILKMQCIATIGNTGVDETLAIQLDYKNGIKAQLVSTFRTNMQNDVIVYGSKGIVKIPLFWMAKEVMLKSEVGDEHYIDESKTMGYNYEVEAVNQDLINYKTQNEIMPHSRTLKMMELMDEIRKDIELKYPFE